MKGCIYQTQAPVNIPQVETRVLTEVLELPYGFEIWSLRAPYDGGRIHPIHDRIRAPARYLPEYLHDAPLRVLAAWRAVRALPGYPAARAAWARDLRRDPTPNRVRRWGQAVVGADGELDRAALGRIVFADARQREELNAIVHPRVEELRSAHIEEARRRGDRVVVCDIPLLFEKRLEGQFDRVVLVDAPADVRRQRLVAERGLSEAEANAMMAAQQPSGGKRAKAQYVLDNAGSLADLERRALVLWQSLMGDADKAATR